MFRSAVSDAGFDPRALLSWLKTNRLIDTRGRNYTRGKRLNRVLTECIALRMKNEAEEFEGFVEIL